MEGIEREGKRNMCMKILIGNLNKELCPSIVVGFL
jgi:hypothetical protein